MRTRHMMLSLTVLSLLLSTCTAFAGDHTNTDEEQPIVVEDAYPIKFGATELQFVARYEDPEEGGGRFVFIPELKVGAFRNTHVWVAGEFLTDTTEEENKGELGILYNFNTETMQTPAFSLSIKAQTDFGDAADWRIRGIVTKSFAQNRFNLNVDYTDAGDPKPGERSTRFRYGLGWDRNIRLDMLLLADVFSQQSKTKDEDAEVMAEVGLRYQADPDTVLAFGIGIGLSGDSDARDLTATAGFSRSF